MKTALWIVSLILCLATFFPREGRAVGITVVPNGATISWFISSMDGAVVGMETYGFSAGAKYVMIFARGSWVTVYQGHPLYLQAVAKAQTLINVGSRAATATRLGMGTTILGYTGTTAGGSAAGGAAGTAASVAIIGIGVVVVAVELGTIYYYQRIEVPKLERRTQDLNRRLGMTDLQMRIEKAQWEDAMGYNSYWANFKKLYLRWW